MERKKQNGLLARLSAVITSRVKTVKVNISESSSSRRIARLLTLTMMCVLSLTSVGVLLLGTPCLSSSAAVDYSKPYNIVPQQIQVQGLSSQFSAENDWRQLSRVYDMDVDAIIDSFKISAYAADNYGEDFQIWLSVYSYENGVTGRTLYDSGWKSSPIVENNFILNPAVSSQFRVVMRIRYNPDSGHYNPPAQNQFNAARYIITYNHYQNYSDIPSDWLPTTTAINTDIPVTAFTTTTYINWDEQVTGNNGFFDTIRYSVSTIFGIGDSWESAVYVMNYINGRLPYVFAISAFCGIVGISVWFLEK